MHPDLLWFFVAVLVAVGVLALGLRRRLLLRLGVRNLLRRRAQSAVVIAGLLVATSIISGSLIIEDTLEAGIVQGVFDTLDAVDLRIENDTSGTASPFAIGIYEDLEANRSLLTEVDGLAPRFTTITAVLDRRTDIPETRANLVAFNVTAEVSALTLRDGGTFDAATLADDEVLLDPDLADNLEAWPGDEVNVTIANATNFGVPEAHTFRVRAILATTGLGGWGSTVVASTVFLSLESFWSRSGLGGGPDPSAGRITAIVVSGVGGVDSGYARSDAIVDQLRPLLPGGFGIDPLKRTLVHDARKGADQLTSFFGILGTFTVIAGVMLVVNIFVMLAEERKKEMGISRALGMRRSALVQAFVYEGLVYALASSSLGSAAGLLVAGLVTSGIRLLFSSGTGGFLLVAHPDSLLLGFAVGFLITLATIVAVSWRISHLNIVRAIRDIPEPAMTRTPRLEIALAVLLLAFGGLAAAMAFPQRSEALAVLGPCVVSLGIATLLRRRLSSRAVFTATGVFLLFWGLKPWRLYRLENADFTLFIVIGLLIVLGGILVVVANAPALLRLLLALTRSRRRLPVVKAAVSYPMNKAFRTGTTMGMIALIIFTMTVVAGFQAMFSSTVDTFVERETGGYPLAGTSAFPVSPAAFDAAFAPIRARFDRYDALPRQLAPVQALPNGAVHSYPVLGVTAGFAANTSLSFKELDAAYTPAGAWRAVAADDRLAIFDGTAIPNEFGFNGGRFAFHVGQRLRVENATGGDHEVTVIGILHAVFTSGLFVKESFVVRDLRAPGAFQFYFHPRDGEDPFLARRALEREFLPYVLSVTVLEQTVHKATEVTLNFITLLQAFLGLGLIVGIAGLGVITMRNVVERRGEMGALRALGFRRSMILEAFLLEISVVSVLGILIGTVTGVLLTYDLWLEFLQDDGPWTVPWLALFVIGLIAYTASLLTTLSPALQAARMPPAEALRHAE